eukprot:7386779-Prymnesium_polylepis.2
MTAAPPNSPAIESTIELLNSTTLLLRIPIAPPAPEPPFASAIPSSWSRAPPVTSKTRELCPASSVAPAPAETRRRSIPASVEGGRCERQDRSDCCAKLRRACHRDESARDRHQGRQRRRRRQGRLKAGDCETEAHPRAITAHFPSPGSQRRCRIHIEQPRSGQAHPIIVQVVSPACIRMPCDGITSVVRCTACCCALRGVAAAVCRSRRAQATDLERRWPGWSRGCHGRHGRRRWPWRTRRLQADDDEVEACPRAITSHIPCAGSQRRPQICRGPVRYISAHPVIVQVVRPAGVWSGDVQDPHRGGQPSSITVQIMVKPPAIAVYIVRCAVCCRASPRVGAAEL